SCAILTGADTVITDNAKLNVRVDELPFTMPTSLPLRQPTRIIIDSQNRLTPELALFSIESPVIIFTTSLDNHTKWPHFVKHEVVPAVNNKVDLSAVLKRLAELQFNHIWLEAGATLAGVFAEQDLIDEYIVYIAPKLIGDMGKSLLNFAEVTMMSDITELTFTDTVMIGDDIRLTATKAKQATKIENKE
ncbi:RibD family protein, partial [uncultured Pseudoalteromonas sp.]